MPAFSVRILRQVLAELPTPSGYVLGLSGGLDSSVLLHALANAKELGVAVRAIHINHQLQQAASGWAQFCADACEGLAVPFETLTVDARAPTGASPEAWARDCRYRILAQRLQSGEALLTAHHQDDQAETLLLQLLRGAGPAGLAGMPAAQRFAQGWLLRPLLRFGRSELYSYARKFNLLWQEDASNRDQHFDRNFLRAEILPRLRKRWPQCSKVLARSAQWQAEAASLLAERAELDLNAVRCVPATGCHGVALSATALAALPVDRWYPLLRLWLASSSLPPPTSAAIQQIRSAVVESRRDSIPLVAWPGVEIRRYRDGIHAMRPLPAHCADATVKWTPQAQPTLELPAGVLRAIAVKSGGLSIESVAGRQITVAYRQGGEMVRPCGSKHRKSLKHTLQERGVAPWLRSYWPLVYIDQTLAVVPGLFWCEPYCPQQGPGWLPDWTFH